MEAFWKILQIKQNNGKLLDLPDISVNRFSRDNHKKSVMVDAKAFFLTHCDYDIMANIFESNFLQLLCSSDDDTKCLYMHKLSYDFLLYWTATISVDTPIESSNLLELLLANKRIVLLETNLPIKIETNSSLVTVTALSAGHHTGSIMLLLEKSPLEDDSGIAFRILHTGCCRFNLRDLRLLSPLHDSLTKKPKKINKLYLDTSFCTKNITELPSRRFVTEQLLELTRLKILNNPGIRFELIDTLVPGRAPIATCAHFLRCIFEQSEEKFHVPESYADFLRNIPKFPELTTFIADEDNSISHFHFCCQMNDDNELCAKEGEWALDFDVNEVSLQSNFSSRGSDEALKFFKDERNWKDHGYEKTVYEEGPTSVRVIYCHNLSRYEQARLINYLNVDPKDVFPLYSPLGTTVKEMRTLLQEACDVVTSTEEPIEIEEDYPSYFYDCTGAPNYNVYAGQ